MDELLTNVYFWLIIVVIIGFIIYPYLNKEKDLLKKLKEQQEKIQDKYSKKITKVRDKSDKVISKIEKRKQKK